MKGRMLSVAVVLVMLILPVTADARWSEVRQGTALLDETRPAADQVLREEQAPTHEALFRSGPVMFIQNAGQWDNDALFQVRGGPVGTVWLAEDAIWITVLEPWETGRQAKRILDPAPRWPTEDREVQAPRRGVNIKLNFVGANPHPHVETFDRLDTTISYFYSNDPEQWRPDVPVWGGVRYVDLYPGIDLEFTNEGGQIVQRLVAQPDADLSMVQLRAEGADAVAINGDRLHLSTLVGEIALPLLQTTESNGEATVLPHAKHLFDISTPFVTLSRTAQFPLTSPDSPVDNPADLLTSTFLGGSDFDVGMSLAVDGTGNVYVTGYTQSSDFPTTPGAFDTSHNASMDVFVAMLDSTGSALSYATFLGGSARESGCSITLDGTGNAYVAGNTDSGDFPTTPGAFDTSYNGGTSGDAFVVKLNPDGSALYYATFLGGSATESGRSITLDGTGNAYVAGKTDSGDFPTTPGAFDTNLNGRTDVFVTKLSPSGSALSYATFLGGGENDYGTAIVVDEEDCAYVTGWTLSSNFPTTPGAFDMSYNGGNGDVFATKLNPDGSALSYATFLGDRNFDTGSAIAVDSAGSAYVTGHTASDDFPATQGAFDTSYNGGNDVFVAKLDPSGSALSYATFLGGSADDLGNAIAVDGVGSAYVTGYTDGPSFPTTPDAFDTSLNGSGDAFVVMLNLDGSALSYATFLGGNGEETGCSIVLDGTGNAYVTGYTHSSDFPTTPGAFDTSHNTSSDVFVSSLAMGGSQSCCDFDGDGIVGVADIIIIAELWGQHAVLPYDQDGDGVITIVDIQRVARLWVNTVSPDSWQLTSTADVPEGRRWHSEVWTGSEMIVWGGDVVGPNGNAVTTNTGARYNPATDTWTPISTSGAPAARHLHTAVWTGTKMIIWGGELAWQGPPTDTGGMYDPTTDTWVRITSVNAPTARTWHAAVWTGTEMVIWGGDLDSPNVIPTDSGGRYNPTTNTWASTSLTGVPSARLRHTAVWSGNEMLIWGGTTTCCGPDISAANGARYNPTTDSWTNIAPMSTPEGRINHVAILAGDRMIVWGGFLTSSGNPINTNTGHAYNPLTNSWSALTTMGAPQPRQYTSAVWTGNEMIIWGGYNGSWLNTGGRYMVSTNTWMPTTLIGAPSLRSEHSAAWTGTQMIIWGGQFYDGTTYYLNTGGRYNP